MQIGYIFIVIVVASFKLKILYQHHRSFLLSEVLSYTYDKKYAK